jgi:hypoxia up-regulated 1
MVEFDASRRALADAKNALESFIYATRDKLYSEGVQEVTNEAQRDKLNADLDAASSWLSDHGA